MVKSVEHLRESRIESVEGENRLLSYLGIVNLLYLRLLSPGGLEIVEVLGFSAFLISRPFSVNWSLGLFMVSPIQKEKSWCFSFLFY